VRGAGRVNGTPPGRATSRAIAPTGPPVVDLTGLRWRGFHGVELPASQLAGPYAVRGGLAWGYARTPLGALLAAVNIGVRANAQWGPRVFAPTIRAQVTGPGAAALLAACQAAYEQERRAAGLPEGAPLGPVYAAEQAFRWVRYSPGAAVVGIVTAGPGDQGGLVRAVTRIQVRWSRGDWRVVAPPGGDWGNSAFPLRSPRGYTFFPAQPFPGPPA